MSTTDKPTVQLIITGDDDDKLAITIRNYSLHQSVRLQVRDATGRAYIDMDAKQARELGDWIVSHIPPTTH